MNEQLYKLLQKAREDAELRKRIWAVKEAKDPALALCELCTAEGFPLTVGGLFSEQEEFFCNLFRSCNGSAVQRRWRNKKRHGMMLFMLCLFLFCFFSLPSFPAAICLQSVQ